MLSSQAAPDSHVGAYLTRRSKIFRVSRWVALGCYLAAARRRPRKTKIAPAVRLSHCEMVALLRSRSLKLDANQASARHQIVPVVTNVSPSVMNAAIFMFDAGSINCGRKAKKNNATFGFRTF